ncbi:MBL fold metallo-hydrolase [Longimicrobium sp.]|uniref:MBL fold metallo-hydrolase n=1 Tax=Longimicrobium sp. TaxID=2029185 RepID=UPI002C6C8729|nr:MBL fold metallo-hydrolase [Longimicrobium sp.]HSU16902.1 MBL fold metallo-hydrolase [Longimicrobium sp.]
MTLPFEESPGVHRVDLNWAGHPGQVAAYLVDGGDALAVVESGPTSTLPAVLGAVRALGRAPEEITHVLVTHVHLDHAGGAGTLLRHAPRAKVHVHPRGARHLADPSRLLASAAMLYGGEMDRLWGEMAPVPADRLVVLEDGDEVRIGTRRLRAVDTPGHAWHHHAYHDSDARLVFTGDVGGIRLRHAPYVCAPTPPPDIDLDAWQESLRRLRALDAAMLLPTHFGGISDPGWHLDDLAARLRGWAAWTEEQARAGADSAGMAAALRDRATADIVAATGSEEMARAYETAVPYPMMAAGLERWWKKARAASR